MCENKRKFIQFNMWKNCRNNCKFCFNRGYKPSDIIDKLHIINFVKTKLLEKEIQTYNEIGFIGGEFFDNELDNIAVKNAFYELFYICSNLKKQGYLTKLCIATHLIYDINKYLVDFIQLLKQLDLLKITLFCTSYDLIYRFKNLQSLQRWQNNMKILNDIYKLNIHTEIIVSKKLIDSIQNNSFDLLNFRKIYNTEIDFIEPSFIEYFNSKDATIKDLPEFFPSRKQFIDFVYKYCIKEKLINLERFLSIKLRSDTSYYKLETGEWIKIDNRWTNGVRRVDKNGKPQIICSYLDSDKNMIDDVESLRKSQ